MSTLSFEHLTLVNFKGFNGEHTFELSRAPGLYYVTGKNLLFPELGANGVGKSTIWDALFWVLFNKTIRDARPANAIVPWDDEKAKCSISLTFKRGMEYKLTRTRKPNSLQLERRGNARELDQSEIEQLIGMSEETFRRTVVLGQFGSLFLDLGPEQQARMFSDALDLNVWLRAADCATQKRKASGYEAADLISSIAKLGGKLEESKTQLASEKEADENFEKRKSQQIRGIEQKRSEYNREVRKILKEIGLE